MEGTVKFFNETKQFGFISGDDGKEYFVHVSGLKEGTTIREGDKVKFEPEQVNGQFTIIKIEKAK